MTNFYTRIIGDVVKGALRVEMVAVVVLFLLPTMETLFVVLLLVVNLVKRVLSRIESSRGLLGVDSLSVLVCVLVVGVFVWTRLLVVVLWYIPCRFEWLRE